MYRVPLPALGFVPVWRDAARRLASHRIDPASVVWRTGDDLFAAEPLPPEDGLHAVSAPASFLTLAETVLCHSDPEAPALLYAALVRHQSDRRALSNPADPLTRQLDRLAKAIRRDIHKMHAFVRFRELPADGPRRAFGAWFEPDHAILERATPFFAKRFADMDWTICTPQGVAAFRDGRTTYHPPAPRPDLPEDASEALWGTYFSNIFNPARIKLGAMRSEMPLKYWKNLPETRLVPEMLAAAEGRVRRMREALPAEAPARAARILGRLEPAAAPAAQAPDLAAHGCAAATCQRCPLHEAASQTVWGEGDPRAPLMIVGEQPGDAEDLAGRPFVGPAGQLLRSIMGEVGVGPVWLTNAVKHFKYTPRGKRRIHASPNRGEIDHCRWWLDQERALLAPRLTVALGASAAYALTGNRAALTGRRGGIERARDGGPVLVTWHPSYILRLDGGAATQARADLSADLAQAVAFVGLPDTDADTDTGGRTPRLA